MVDQDTAAALQLLHNPACMASAHGAMKFDHAGYRKMAEQGSMVVTSFALSDVDVMPDRDDSRYDLPREAVRWRAGRRSQHHTGYVQHIHLGALGQPLAVCSAYRIADGGEPS